MVWCHWLKLGVLSSFGRIQLCATLWSIACQAPLSMGFPRKEHWSGLSFPPPGDLPNPRIEPVSPEAPALQADFFFLITEPPGKTWCRVTKRVTVCKVRQRVTRLVAK